MGSRANFQLRLESLVPQGAKVYFQPPAGLKMTYPCVIYHLARIDTYHADNLMYRHMKGYTVTYVDRNPDASFPDTYLASQPMTHFDRMFVSDNLNHWVFTTYY